ncbi:MAG: hypothetical protein EAZ24_02585 [Burkholderiales bacterium]|nr:MAG: hypothetical protein EAZ21_03555 [Betaproteobacteria bacterium]TAG83799.1 MAG: hypothetical protein EAZ24_02585 [Burkholderiales bacterium]
MKKAVLLFSSGPQVAQSGLHLVAGRRNELRVIATDRTADAPELAQLKTIYLVPTNRANQPAYEAKMVEILKTEPVDLSLRYCNHNLVTRAALVARHPDLREGPLCGASNLARRVADKPERSHLAKKVDRMFTESFDPRGSESAGEFAKRVDGSLMSTPRGGLSLKCVMPVKHEAQLPRALARSRSAIEKYVSNPDTRIEANLSLLEEGTPLYWLMYAIKRPIELLFDRDSTTAAAVLATHKRQSLRARFATPNRESNTLTRSRRRCEVLSKNSWRSPPNVQCQRESHAKVRIREFNGASGALALEKLLPGHEDVALGLILASDVEEAQHSSRGASEPAMNVSAQLSSHGAHPSDVAALQSAG